jgi:capsular exopolysaccharide synthesis family protein
MSRIQDILSKAERDGTTRRTRSVNDDYAARPRVEEPRVAPASDDAVHARAFVEAPPRFEPHRGAPPATRPPAMPPRVTPGARDAAPAASDLAPNADAPAGIAGAAAPRTARAGAAEYAVAVAAPASTIEPAPVDSRSHGTAELDSRLVAALAPTSLAAEQYRSLRTRLKRVESGRALRTIAITSPAKGDGKSLTAANLAITMAQEVQQRVLIVDGDLRRPTVHRLFGLGEGPGLGDVLMNMAELDQALVWLPEHQLTVLPAGLPPSNPAELLGSATMRRILDTLRTRFDRILIDVPPVAPLADLHILAPLVDGLLMIVRAGITPKPAIERALAGLDPGKVLGLVLNEAGGNGTDTYNYEGYGYIAG